MSREHMHAFFKQFQYDPMAENTLDQNPYIYNAETVDQHYDKHTDQGNTHFAILLNDEVIGDIYLKHFNQADKSCQIGIYLVNDRYKGKGFGTQAEHLLLGHVFANTDIELIYADTLKKNHRSRHVLEKVGFTVIRTDGERIYLECKKKRWADTRQLKSVSSV